MSTQSPNTPPPITAQPLDHALHYASRGFHVFPLHTVAPKTLVQGNTTVYKNHLFCTCAVGHRFEACRDAGKHPVVDKELGLINGLKHATTDESTIRAWWKEHGIANVGIATGKSSSIIVVDIDPKNGGTDSWLELCATHGTPETLCVQTGSGGYHYYFAHPGDAEYKSSSNAVAPGIDVRADGGYVVAPPSRHISGNRYVIMAGTLECATLPAWLAERIERREVSDTSAGKSPLAARVPVGMDRQFSAPSAARIETQCAWLKHCHGDAAQLSETEWYWMLSILSRCEDGRAIAHAWSAPYPQYNARHTDEKFDHAAAASGPITCATIGSLTTLCAACTHRGRIKSPASLGGSRACSCANFVWDTLTKDDKPKRVKVAKSSPAICEDLLTDAHGWPKAVNGMPFVLDTRNITEEDPVPAVRFLSEPEKLYAWIGQRMPLAWADGSDPNGNSFVTKSEFFHVLGDLAEHYVSAERFPHEPPLPRHYYLWQPPTDYTPTGEYLDALLAHIDNATTTLDMALIRAMFLLPALGCPNGKRPIIVIEANDSGSGKTTLTDILGLLYGGIIEYKPSQRGEDEFMSRLLSENALLQRIIRIDNAKTEVGGQFIEYLATAEVYSGKRMYFGEAKRPNTCTTVITGNTVRLTEDMTNRCYFIRLNKPEYDPTWEPRIKSFATANRHRILADIVWTLQQPAAKTEAADRWPYFVHEILTRCGADPMEIIEVTKSRRGGHDNDRDEAQMIVEALQLAGGEDCLPESDELVWVFVTRTDAREAVERALGMKLNAKAFVALMKRHADAGHFSGMVVETRRHTRGWKVCHGDERKVKANIPW